jgi:copper oxidase (laccase) domain-containing protein
VGEEVVAAYSGRFTDSERFFCPVLPSKPSEAATSRSSVVSLSQHPPGRSLATGPAARLDLAAVVVAQLRAAGLSARNIAVSGLCTACRADLFFSHRKEGGGTGRMLAVIGIRP